MTKNTSTGLILFFIVFIDLLNQTMILCLCPSHCTCDDMSLKVLCSAANLEVIPYQLNPAVQQVNLSQNRIKEVDFTLKIYTNLISLDLSRNCIDKLGNSNFELHFNLKVLNLSNNIIESLVKENFKGLKNLVVLDISNNNLKHLSSVSFKELLNLVVLKINSNRLEYLESGLLKYNKKLEKLYLNNNQLLQIPKDAIFNCAKLSFLSLSENLIEYIEEGMAFLPELKILLLNTNVINRLSPSALSNLESLQILDISDNNFTVIPTDSLSKLSNLVKLDLSGNFLKSIPAVSFRGLFHLRKLFLNRLEFLTHIDARAFVDNTFLEKVSLDNNIAFQNLPLNFVHGNPKITAISITNNQISSLHVSHFPLDKLRSLKLGNNPLQCNCSLYWLWKLIQEQNSNQLQNLTDSDDSQLILDVRDIRCAGPEYVHDRLLLYIQESLITCSLGWISILSFSVLAIMIIGLITLLFYFVLIKRRFNKSESQPKPGNSHSHYNIPYQDNTQMRKCVCDYPGKYLLPEVNDTWTLSSNIMQISR